MKVKSVLIIEDSYSSSLLIAETLKNEGYWTQIAEDVHNAIDLIKNNTPDVIILDLNMPEVTGYDFLRMRESLSIEDIPIIVVSALDSPESINEVKSLGALDFIPKPLKLDLLVERVGSLT